ncbi:transposase, partial [Parafrankia sp. Ea1.12]|uniref:transposase n=1 Tax=Parafrankia sp. Ea1.12 TaxID=573499 RepID=UPI001F1FEF35
MVGRGDGTFSSVSLGIPRYPSDLTDAEWAYVQPLLPAASKDGRPEKHDRRDIVDAILY